MKEYTFSTFNNFTDNSIAQAIDSLNHNKKTIILVCIGSDLVLGDSLGPLIGTMLKKKNLHSYVYGTLHSPITAKEVEHAKVHLKQMHPNALIVALDAAVGSADDVGTIRVIDKGLKPGLGVNKDLSEIGDISIIGVVAPKSNKNYNLYNLTRLNLIYKMAEKIANGIDLYEKSLTKRAVEASIFNA